ncbi:MAG: hypothetical protein CMJ80_07300 [Planctomycetaceae bacterium]|nr:hypothetical protein [Planctomycetaceae bacterium]
MADKPRMTLVAICLLCFFLRLGDSKLWDRDEPRNARCAAEMLERGDWVVPTFNDELRTHKPILTYWLMMISYRLFGESEFAARFWSAVMASGTVLLTYRFARQFFDIKTANWAAIILASNLMFNIAAHAATPDASLIFFSMAAITAFAVGFDTPSPHTRWMYFLLSYVSMGMAVLSKGPVGIVLPLTVCSAASWWLLTPNSETQHTNRSLTWLTSRLRLHHLFRTYRALQLPWGLLVVGVVALPWYSLVGIQTDGVWLKEFFFEHNVGRAMRPMEGHSGPTLFYYPLAILVGFFPWSVFALPVVLWTYTQCREKPPAGMIWLLAWTTVYVVTFSIASTKLPSYVAPIYPVLAILCGNLLTNWETAAVPRRAWTWRAAGCLTLVGAGMVVTLPVTIHHWMPGDEWLGSIGLIPLVGGAMAFRSFQNYRCEQGFRRIAYTSVGLILSLFAIVAPRVSQHQHIDRLLADIPNDGQHRLVSFGVHEPSWVFYADAPIPFVPLDDTKNARIRMSSTTHVITSKSVFSQHRDKLPPDMRVMTQVPYFLKNDTLILLTRLPSEAIVSNPPSPSH